MLVWYLIFVNVYYINDRWMVTNIQIKKQNKSAKDFHVYDSIGFVWDNFKRRKKQIKFLNSIAGVSLILFFVLRTVNNELEKISFLQDDSNIIFRNILDHAICRECVRVLWCGLKYE